MKSDFKNKSILVTGGTGSIGSEIVKQLMACQPKVLRVLSRDETKQVFLRDQFDSPPNLRFLIGDIRNQARLRRAMEGVDYVFHAAAMKHVPVCEYNPFEAVQTNVLGTQNVIEAAVDCGVKKVIAISTDKAITPTNTMGATKLLGEKLLSVANLWAKDTLFGCVRFGNVLSSRGSLLPVIEQKIKDNKPVTLTDEGMTRFFMSIPQAVGLVLKASVKLSGRSKGGGGECFILRMPALRISDLLDELVDIYAPRYGKKPADIKRKTIGIREGEKLHEVLLTDDELKRTKQLSDMFCVSPPRKGGRKLSEIDKKHYDSEHAVLLDRKAIRKMLKDAGV